MKRLFATLLLFFLSPLTCAQSPPMPSAPASADKESCSISGIVVRQDTGEPLRKAKVTLSSQEKHEDSTFDITDAQGHFLLDGLPCHSYFLTASHPGFVDASYGQRKPTDPGATLALSPGQKLTDLVFKLQRAAVVTGRVFDENGEFVQDAMVRVVQRTHGGKRRDFQEAGQGLTNDLGEFRIYDLKPGRYYISVSYTPWSEQWGGFGPTPGRQLRKKGYPLLYYPGTADPSKAVALTLNPGDELAAVDFRLQLTSMNTVSGKFLNLSGTSARRGANVILTPRGSELPTVGWDNFQSHTLEGTFAIYGVPPGSYNIQAVSFDSETSKAVRSVRRELEVTDSDVEGLTLVFAPGVGVGGRMVWDAGKGADLSSLTLFLFPTDDDSFGVQPQSVKSDGFFQLQNVSEGEYRPLVRSTNENCYLKSARAGNTPMVDGKLSIHSGGDNSLEFVVSCRASQLSGQVLTGDSLPAVGVFVVLVPEPRFRDDPRSYVSVTTDQNGRFLLKGVKPGDYKLFSWASVETGDWQDADFLKAYEDKGVSVHLEEGDRKSADLTLIEPPRDAPPANE